MNGAGPPDRVSRWLYRRCRDGPEHIYLAESSHAKVLKKNNQRAVPVATGAPGRIPLVIRPRFALARTRHQGPWKVACTGTSP